MAGSNWAQLLPQKSPPPDQVEKQWWSTIPDQGGQLGSGGGHERHTPGTEGLYVSCCTVIDTTVCGLFLAHTKRDRRGGKVRCHWRGSTSRTTRTVIGLGTLLLRAVVVVIPLLLVVAGDVELNPGPEGSYHFGKGELM